MKSSINLFAVCFLFGSAVCKIAVAAPSLCAPTESVIFSCSTAASKIIALCRAERSRLITYRYGKSKRVEMSYSAEQGGENGFFYNHYFRSSVDYARIAFAVSGYEYSVFRSYDVTDASTPKYGVVASKKNGDDEARIECHSQVIDNMEKIITHLKCDTNSALGCS